MVEINKKISAIMPVFNAEKYLRQSIESILNQSYKFFEFIIVNDASSDNSLKIIKAYAKIDKRIKIISNTNNIGEAASRNKGIFNATGDFIAIVDSDDICHKDRFLLQTSLLNKHKNLVVVGSNIELINNKNIVFGIRKYPLSDKQIRKTIPYKSPFAHPSVIIRKSALESSGYYNEELVTACDYDLWFRLLENGEGMNLNKFLLKYRLHKDQSKEKQFKLTISNTILIQRKYLFSKKYFSFFRLFFHLFFSLLLIVPNKFVLLLFFLTQYKLNKKTTAYKTSVFTFLNQST